MTRNVGIVQSDILQKMLVDVAHSNHGDGGIVSRSWGSDARGCPAGSDILERSVKQAKHLDFRISVALTVFIQLIFEKLYTA